MKQLIEEYNKTNLVCIFKLAKRETNKKCNMPDIKTVNNNIIVFAATPFLVAKPKVLTSLV
jgi:hypothetical protein